MAFQFQMSLAGPSRVGKTSLVTSMLSQSRELLAGTPVSMTAGDNATEIRISDNREELRGIVPGGHRDRCSRKKLS